MSDRTTDLPFEVTAEQSISSMEQVWQWIDLWVYTPLSIIWTDVRSRIGLGIVLLYLLMGTVGVMVVAPPELNEGPELLGPFQSLEYPLGTTMVGRDLFALIVHSTPAMLKMITSGAIFATGVATILGTVSGYKGGFIDRAIMTFTDIAIVIPGLPLIIVISIAFPPKSPWIIGIVLTINAWAGLARSLRSEVLSIRQASYIEAANAMDIRTHTIITRNILPNIMPYILINFMQTARRVIFASVGLYFLGLLPYTNLNWGIILNRAYINGGLVSPNVSHWIFAPIIAIGLLTFGLVFFSQGLDQLFNPRVRARHAKTIKEEQPHQR